MSARWETEGRTLRMSTDAWRSAREDYIGWCRSCGEERDSTEPDARAYECEACGEPAVYGAEEWLMAGWVETTAPPGEGGVP
jgi:hypothetical protein